MPGQPGLAVGLDVGGTKVLGVALDADDQVVAERRVPTALAESPAAMVELLVSVVASLVHAPATGSAGGNRAAGDQAAGADVAAAGDGAASPLASVGVGLPGRFHDGALVFAPNLAVARGLDVSEPLSRRLQLPVAVDNDATCATVAEWHLGGGSGSRHMILVAAGTGIGTGLVVGGAVVRGAAGMAGEAGHLTLDPAGPACPCGRQGCWEQFASGGALERLARHACADGRLPHVLARADGNPNSVRAEHVVAAAHAGDGASAALLEEVGERFAQGVGILAAILDPEVVVIGGGFAAASPALLEATGRLLATGLAGQPPRPAVVVRPAQLGERAGAVGAAILGRQLGLGQTP